jgi:hypothetical protein
MVPSPLPLVGHPALVRESTIVELVQRTNTLDLDAPELPLRQIHSSSFQGLPAKSSGEQNYEELMREVKENLGSGPDWPNSPIEFSSPIDRVLLDVRELNTVQDTSNSGHLGYEKTKNASGSEENYVVQDQASTQASTRSVPTIISTPFESNGDIGLLPIPRSPPHLPLGLRDGNDPVNKKQIEESDAE